MQHFLLNKHVFNSMAISVAHNFLQLCKSKTPVFKQGSRNQIDNYRPFSIVPIISKLFEKPIGKQISKHFENI